MWQFVDATLEIYYMDGPVLVGENADDASGAALQVNGGISNNGPILGPPGIATPNTYLIDVDGHASFADGACIIQVNGQIKVKTVLFTAAKVGTLLAPPAGLAIDEAWLDTTDSAQYPILRIRKT